ncbi:hypothetical protein [Nostoc sp. MS1]|uniref:hypothetical protein n=1 Tax=Nostoc sp. MS1 TaxID=2764711 RepID=UPI001CC54F3D|nr:hypothetical protein [Nostoc sp. MS1]BCL39389.1 hypothetical protein NSMS1_58360 [Nostoc sp. MS1]
MSHRINAISSLLVGLVAAYSSQSIAFADISGKHPYYLHARSDLQQAELILQQPDEPNVSEQEKLAYNKVHEAIQEIDKAAVLDRKQVNTHPAIDSSLKHLDKYRSIYKLLRSAEKDISIEEDNRSAIGWRNRAKNEIEQAKRYVENAASKDVVDDLRENSY